MIEQIAAIANNIAPETVYFGKSTQQNDVVKSPQLFLIRSVICSDKTISDLFPNFQNHTILYLTRSQTVARHFPRVISIDIA